MITICLYDSATFHTAQHYVTIVTLRDVTDFESDFGSVGFRRFFTNLNPSDLRTRFLSDSDLITDSGKLNFRKINCCPLIV